jgi:hypothetical protein
MPCRDWGEERHYEAIAAAERKARLDAATRAACEALQLVPDGCKVFLSPETLAWWEHHQKDDAKRNATKDD